MQRLDHGWDGGVPAADQPADARIATLQQELRAKEEYLQAANDELTTLLEHLDDGFCRLDRDWRLVDLNGRAVALLQRPRSELQAAQLNTIGVNAYLWRASLDTLSFMPMVQTDSNGGVIVTDWYTNPNTPSERMKVTVSILDQDLRADALRVAASRQVNQNGQWVDAPVQAATVQKLEEIILTKARDLRRMAIG